MTSPGSAMVQSGANFFIRSHHSVMTLSLWRMSLSLPHCATKTSSRLPNSHVYPTLRLCMCLSNHSSPKTLSPANLSPFTQSRYYSSVSNFYKHGPLPFSVRNILHRCIYRYKCFWLTDKHFSTSVHCRCLPLFTDARTRPPWRVMFLGTDNFSLVPLKALNDNRLHAEPDKRTVETLDVICHTSGNKTPVMDYARGEGLIVHEWPAVIDHARYDVGVLASFGVMIPSKVIKAFPHGIINIHPSLLPRWRGASPIIHTILNGDAHTGVSIMEIRPKHFDTGAVLLQRTLPVPDRCTSSHLTDLLAGVGAHMIMEVLASLPSLDRQEVEQSSRGVTYAHKITPGMEYIDWESQTITDVDRQYRALHEHIPLRSIYRGQKARLYDMVPPNDIPADAIDAGVQKLYGVSSSVVPPGSTFFLKHQQCLCVKCKDGWVGFKRLSVKSPMSAQSFYNGFLSQADSQDVRFVSRGNNVSTQTQRQRISKS